MQEVKKAKKILFQLFVDDEKNVWMAENICRSTAFL